MDGQQHLPSTPAFAAWYRCSQVPGVVYHGTDAEDDFTVFSITSDIGYHFGTLATAQARLDQIEAAECARIIPVYLSIQNPLELPDLLTWEPMDAVIALRDAGVLADAVAAGYLADGYFDEGDFAEALEAMGYDGVVYRNQTEGGGQSYIALRSSQIKSAIGNAGTFSAECMDICR